MSKESLETLKKSLDNYVIFMEKFKRDPTEASVKTLNKYLFKKLRVMDDIKGMIF
jgi:hypothetical protein